MSFEGSVLTVGPYQFDGVVASDIVVIAIGKAAPAMASGAHDVVDGSRGFVVTTHNAASPYPTCIGSHPVPEESSRRCGESLLAFAAETDPSDVVVFLVSGGGSAAATLPVPGVTVDDIATMNGLLIDSGLPIGDINEVRASVSRLKGGLLGASVAADHQVTMVLSDVIGVGREHVASGPSIGFGLGNLAVSVLDTSGLRPDMPDAVVRAIDRFVPIDRPTAIMSTTIGSPLIAAEAAVADLTAKGFDAFVVSSDLMGEARSEAVALVDRTNPGTISVAAGETTVTIRGIGVGGRNQEAAVAAALHIDGRDALFGALGTDGIDGPTPAAGAIVDGGTVSRAERVGVDLAAALENNDSHTVLTALDETIVTGPSGTNVADLWIAAKGPF
jgi:glycerate-2-kinase